MVREDSVAVRFSLIGIALLVLGLFTRGAALALLGGVSVSTLDAGGAVLESADTSDGLRLTLLGAYVIGQDAYLLSMPVTQPFRGLRVSMGAGVATVAQSLRVNSACATTSE